MNGRGEMSPTRLELDDTTMARAEQLARQRGFTVEQLLRSLVEGAFAPAENSLDTVLGFFGDDPELMDQIVQNALRARELEPFRLPDG